MAESLLSTITSLAREYTNDFDLDRIQELTGQDIDTVDQFKAKTNKFRKKNYTKGLIAGLAGGLVAVGVKMLVDRQMAPDTEQIEDRIADRAVDSMEEMSGQDFTEAQEDFAAAMVEFGMGALIGGAYGLIVEAIPDTSGMSRDELMETTKQVALPALGLVPVVGADVANSKVQNLAGHAAFIGTVEAVRRAVRLGLED